jgi:hypothetical protein
MLLMDRPALMLLLERDQGLGRFELFGLAELLRLGGFLAGFLGRHGEPPSEMCCAARTPRIMHLIRNRLHNFLHAGSVVHDVCAGTGARTAEMRVSRDVRAALK